MKDDRIPRATVKRLPLYYRHLNILSDQGKNRISSEDLSEIVKVDSATIRKDFSYFGELGRKGYGYDIQKLIQFFRKILDQDEVSKVALIGVGNLGKALLNYNFIKNDNMRIDLAFDTNEQKIGHSIGNVSIYALDELETKLKESGIQAARLTVPGSVSQQVADRLVESGIEGILNFTPIRLNVPDTVQVHSIDLAVELQTLNYFLKNKS